MYGYVVPARRTKIIQERVCGMPLLRMELSPRRQKRINRVLQKYHVHRLLSQMPTQRLWTNKALDAALTLLNLHGIPPEQSTVEFHSLRCCPEDLLLPFLPHVRTISLTGCDDESLVWHLQREYGISPCTTHGDLTICLSPVQRKLVLPLYDSQPAISQLQLYLDGLSVSDDCPIHGLLAALLEQGRIRSQDIKIRANFS